MVAHQATFVLICPLRGNGEREIAITSRRKFLPRPIAVAAFAMFRHKEDDRACDAASRDNSFWRKRDKAARCGRRYQWAKDVTRNEIPGTCDDMSQLLIKITVCSGDSYVLRFARLQETFSGYLPDDIFRSRVLNSVDCKIKFRRLWLQR